MPDTRRRRSRFRRATDNLPGLRITPRDLSLLRHLAAHRFLRSSHFPDLIGGSLQGILRRLALLFHHGYVERPRAQLDGYFRLAGSAPIVYSLAPRGAALLRSHGMPFQEMAWTRQRPSGIGTLFLHHALLVVDCAIGAEISCRTHAAAFRPLRDLDLHAEPSPRGRGSWSVRVDPATSVGVVPDAIFAVEAADGSACLYFLEADRGTMPVHRDGLDQSSFHRKLLAYRATWKDGLHRERFGFSRFRVLTATSSRARRDHLLAACAALPGGRRLFLFADAGELRAHGDFLTFPWSSPDGGTEPLVP